MPAEGQETGIPCGSGAAAHQPQSTVTIEKREAESVSLDQFFKYMYRKIYFEELAHTVMGTAQSKIYGAVRKFR